MILMKKMLILIVQLGMLSITNVTAQVMDPEEIQPESTYENIHVRMIYSDSLSSSFVIWVKNEVPAHKHNHHTEVITIIEGEAKFKLAGTEYEIKKGDIIVVPMGTVHSVVTTSVIPLKVLSVQSPIFDGSDREKVY